MNVNGKNQSIAALQIRPSQTSGEDDGIEMAALALVADLRTRLLIFSIGNRHQRRR